MIHPMDIFLRILNPSRNILTSFGLLRDILEKYACGLYQLNIDVSIVELENPNEVLHHVLFTE